MQNKEISEVIELINTIILSMAAKQEILNNMESNVFSANIYDSYINLLIKANAKLLNVSEKEVQVHYRQLIKDFITGNLSIEQLELKLKNNFYFRP